MNLILEEAKRYLKIYGMFFKNCLIAQMEYRANFIMGFLIESASLFAKILYVIVVYQAGITIKGYTPDMILLFVGTFAILSGIMMGMFFFNLTKMQSYIQNGTLDIFITKPISMQFFVTLRYIDLGTPTPNIIGGIVMVAVAWNRLGIPNSFKNLAGYVLFIIGGTFISYAILLVPSLLSFWVLKSKSLFDITYGLWDFNNMPMTIYGKYIRTMCLYIIPIFAATNIPVMFVLGNLSTVDLIWGIAAPVILMVLIRLLWNKAIKNYSSASS